MYSILCPEKLGNKSNFINTTEKIRDVRCTSQPLREVWLKIGLEKLENHEGVTVKALLDSGATGLFIDMTFAKEKGFKIEKLKNPLLVRNMDRTANVGEAIMHQVKCNMFFKGHVERARMDVCNLGKTEVILEMPWLAAHNPEIDWEKGEVKITWCSSICGKRKQEVKEKAVKRTKEDEDKKVLRELVPKKLRKVFGKKKSERMPVRKAWDHAIELKEGFMPKKKKVYSLSREERGGIGICGGPTKKRVYLTFQVTPNFASTFCSQKR